MKMSATWETRCVTSTPHTAFTFFGFYVALDAFRFGAPCHR
jgi:hypothetical protein